MAYTLSVSLSLAQSFVLAKPDTAKLKALQEQVGHAESLTYLYLKTYYKPASPKNSVIFNEWDKERACAFQQNFESGISYAISNCEEGKGISEMVTFPKVSLTALRSFIETLYLEPDNSWVAPLLFEPEEVGCFYEIKETDKNVSIEIFCGC
ncbi:hypothetical protein [uncultured Pontibacter sp.]|uniref:hypothetical protein n=1 Tax=uncultured Pontibacter sp. TaxID=453356 RepID=UPI00262F0DB7|nr:hypothetical protein [uncultured Pontibacter sp.]